MVARKILIVDDSKELLGLYTLAFAEKYTVRTATGPHEALRLLGQVKPDVLMTDYHMGESLDGLDLIRIVRQSHPAVKCLLNSASMNDDLEARAHAMGVPAVQKGDLTALYRALDGLFQRNKRKAGSE